MTHIPQSSIILQYNIIMVDLPVNSEELLIERRNVHKNRVDRNRLLLIAVVNIITFLCAIFAMAYTRWIHIDVTINSNVPKQKPQVYKLWVSLLYASIEQPGPSQYYLTYPQIQELICNQQDNYCLAIFYQLDFVGKLCFGIFSFAFLISTYDVIKIITFACKDVVTRSKFFIENNAATHFKNHFRSVLMIITYFVGMTLNYQAMSLISVEYYYGLSFWIFFASLIVLAVAVFFQNRKMSQISREELVLRLIQNEKAMLRVSKESEDSKSDHYVI